MNRKEPQPLMFLRKSRNPSIIMHIQDGRNSPQVTVARPAPPPPPPAPPAAPAAKN